MAEDRNRCTMHSSTNCGTRTRRRTPAHEGARRGWRRRPRPPELREAFETHLEETQGQIERLEQVFASLDEKVRGKHCDGIAGIIEEGKSIMEEDFDETTMDACLIAAGQRAEHYEMAAYGTLIAWARAEWVTPKPPTSCRRPSTKRRRPTRSCLDLAEGGINQGAADAAHPEEEEELARVAVGAAARKLGVAKGNLLARSWRADRSAPWCLDGARRTYRTGPYRDFAHVADVEDGNGSRVQNRWLRAHPSKPRQSSTRLRWIGVSSSRLK